MQIDLEPGDWRRVDNDLARPAPPKSPPAPPTWKVTIHWNEVRYWIGLLAWCAFAFWIMADPHLNHWRDRH